MEKPERREITLHLIVPLDVNFITPLNAINSNFIHHAFCMLSGRVVGSFNAPSFLQLMTLYICCWRVGLTQSEKGDGEFNQIFGKFQSMKSQKKKKN